MSNNGEDPEEVNKKLNHVREKIAAQLTDLYEKEGIGHDIIYTALYEVIVAIEDNAKKKGLSEDYFQTLRGIAQTYYDETIRKVE